MVTNAAKPLDQWARRGGSTVAVAEAGTVLSGTAGLRRACPRSGSGAARSVRSFRPRAGDILITLNTDPSWTPCSCPRPAW